MAANTFEGNNNSAAMKRPNHSQGDLMNEQQPVPVQNETWLDSQDILTRMNISERTLQNWRREKLLPYYKIRGKIYYKQSELNGMIEKGKV
jgi:hypothetical protein